VRIRQQDEAVHRPDLEEEDLHGHRVFLTEQFGSVRSAVDAPFSHGILLVASDSPRVFSDSDIAILEELAGALSEGFRRLVDLQQLAAERQRLAVTLRSIGESVVATDAEGRIVLINRIAESLTGWSSGEVEGRPLSDVLQILDHSTRKPLDSLVQRVLETGTAIELVPNGILVSRNGAERLISTSSAPIRDDEGKTIGVVLVSRDVGAQRKMEEELLKSAKLESLGVLAGGIAHDFNNILTTIIGYLSLAKMDIDPAGELFANLSEVEEAAKRATDLTHQLLAFSKGGAPVKKTASVAELITDSATFTTRGSNVRCTFDLAEVLPPAEVDVSQMSQVIQNLVLNADQAMPEGGTIHVSAQLREITASAALPLKSGQYIQIGVRDHGPGITADNLPRIFDPYFTTKQEGNGLGLATAYAIVKNHDGHITVESPPGQGAIFFVYLPASSSPVEPRTTGTNSLFRVRAASSLSTTKRRSAALREICSKGSVTIQSLLRMGLGRSPDTPMPWDRTTPLMLLLWT
jgi:two-component system cell cycle sensor histidine kinase/response regulator CckA